MAGRHGTSPIGAQMPLADELAQVRLALRALKARERVLVARAVAQGAATLEGFETTLLIRPRARPLLDPARLPESIRDDPRYRAPGPALRVRLRPHAPDAGAPVIVFRGDLVAVARRRAGAPALLVDAQEKGAAP